MQELLFNEIVAYEKQLDFNTAFSKAQEYMKMYPDDQEAKKELEFLQSRIAQENVEEPAPKKDRTQLRQKNRHPGRVDMQLYDFKEIQERVILVGVQTDIGDDVEASLTSFRSWQKLQEQKLRQRSFRTEKQYIREPISEKAKFRK